MKRPLTDYFTPAEITAAFMRYDSTRALCFACEEPCGQSYYRITSLTHSTAALVCSPCTRKLQGEIHAAKLAKRSRLQLTESERKMTDRFTSLPKLDQSRFSLEDE